MRILPFILASALCLNACVVLSELDTEEAETIIDALKTEVSEEETRSIIDDILGQKAICVDDIEYILSNIDTENRVTAAECLTRRTFDTANVYVLYNRFEYNENIVNAIKSNIRFAKKLNYTNFLYRRRVDLNAYYVWEPKEKVNSFDDIPPGENDTPIHELEEGDLDTLLSNAVVDEISYDSCDNLAQNVQNAIGNHSINAITAGNILRNSQHCCDVIQETATYLASHLADPENNHLIIDSTSCANSHYYVLTTLKQQGDMPPQKYAYISDNSNPELNVAPPELSSFIVTDCALVLDSVKVNIGRRLVTSEFARQIITNTPCCTEKQNLFQYFLKRLSDPENSAILIDASQCSEHDSSRRP